MSDPRKELGGVRDTKTRKAAVLRKEEIEGVGPQHETLNNANQVAEYTYNGAGQRIKKVTQTETRIFHYDLRGHLITETNQSGQMLVEYIYLGDQLLSMINPGELVYYYHNDHLGTPQILTNDSQAIAWKAVYAPFGEAVASIQTVENPFRFPGQYYDQETGLHYNYFRYYNPQTGRYITPDPIGLWGGVNLFGYVAGNPLRWADSLGLVDDMTLTYFYQLLSKTGEHQKFGITADPLRRYTQAELAGGELNILSKGPRSEMRALEQEFHKYLPPGPREGQYQYKIIQERMGIKGKTVGKISLCKPAIGKTLGAIGMLLDLLDAYEAAKIAEQTGKNPWQIMLEMKGYSSDNGEDMI